jgi:hypothetical protein
VLILFCFFGGQAWGAKLGPPGPGIAVHRAAAPTPTDAMPCASPVGDCGTAAGTVSPRQCTRGRPHTPTAFALGSARASAASPFERPLSRPPTTPPLGNPQSQSRGPRGVAHAGHVLRAPTARDEPWLGPPMERHAGPRDMPALPNVIHQTFPVEVFDNLSCDKTMHEKLLPLPFAGQSNSIVIAVSQLLLQCATYKRIPNASDIRNLMFQKTEISRQRSLMIS